MSLSRAYENAKKCAVGLFLTLGMTVSAQGALLGPSPYSSSADSPFAPFVGFTYFHLEDFEDGMFNVPGVTAIGSGLCIVGTTCFVGSGLTDSVENGQAGHDHWANGSITYTFDASVLGALPNAVGLVWTDGVNNITFEAFDQSNNSLGILVGTHADGSFTGGTAEDRFYGVTHSGGISRVVISDPSGIEVDHLQYGLRGPANNIPEPATLALLGVALAGFGFSRRRKLAKNIAGPDCACRTANSLDRERP